MNYSAVAIHPVNQTVHVDGHARVLSLNEAEEQELHVGRHFPDCSAIRGCGETPTTRELRTAPH
jgi:hypothetical protein